MSSEGNDRTIMQVTTVLFICAMASEVSEGVCGVVGVAGNNHKTNATNYRK